MNTANIPAHTAELGQRDRSILDLEQGFWKYVGAKETAIRERLDMSATRYYQRLNVLLDTPAAAAYAPITVNRLRRATRGR
ncbi:DUF3263 domain-containing protein [Ruania halotolerans]|uniref:DUF3263 domain-containing protein n=1 Tax=Ruania halotolerans TaxID=2897773 RepID=UPI001E4862D4|nr:DUF3263 domain-containing protein [Ruania halotolerans]UFU05483.1 DUF3263 domain-containing protein [Ruania halotolerans]